MSKVKNRVMIRSWIKIKIKNRNRIRIRNKIKNRIKIKIRTGIKIKIRNWARSGKQELWQKESFVETRRNTTQSD